MNLTKLAEVLRVLKQVSEKQELTESFNLRDWMDGESVDEEVLEAQEAEFKEADQKGATLIHIPHKCGTTACAVGYAGLDPWFRARGLKTDNYGGISYHRRIQHEGLDISGGWHGVIQFFECTGTEARVLFDPDYYSEETTNGGTLNDVIARIEQVLAGTFDFNNV